MTIYSGSLITLLAGERPSGDKWTELLASIHGLIDPLTTFVPVWTSSGTQPSIGDGTLEGRYTRSGKWVYYTGRLLTGSTTTFGTGTYSMSIPVTSESGNRYMGGAVCVDISAQATNNQSATCRMDGVNACRFYGSLVGGQIGATVPFTWATGGDSLIWSILYYAA